MANTLRITFQGAVALFAAACGSEATLPGPAPRPDPVPAETALVLGLSYGQHQWLGEVHGDRVVRQAWLPDPAAQFGPAPTTWYLEGGTLLLPALDGPERQGFRIWEVDFHGEQEQRPTAYAEPALASLQWGADGSLLHLDYEAERGPLVRVVDMPSAVVADELVAGMPGGLGVRMLANADGTMAVVLGADQGWASTAALQPEGWAFVHGQGPGIERLKAGYFTLGTRRGILLDPTPSRTYDLAWINLEKPDLPVTHSSTYPHQLRHALVDPDDEVALLVGETLDDPEVEGWAMWHPASNALVDLSHLDLSMAVTLLPSPDGVRIVDGALGQADGSTWLDWYDVAVDGRIQGKGRFELEPPPRSGWAPAYGIAPVLTGANPWGD